MRARAGLWVLLALLVAAQTLGLMHRILHAPHGAVGTPSHVGHAHHGHDHDHHHGHDDGDEHGHGAAMQDTAAGDGAGMGSGWASLFGGHESATDCHLYDQLTPLDLAALVPAVVLPLFLPAYWLTFSQGEALARHAALFEARAPPTVR